MGEDFDVIVCSDLIFDPAEWANLRRSLCLLGSKTGVIYLAHRTRNVQEKHFFDTLNSDTHDCSGGARSENLDRRFRYQQLFPPSVVWVTGGNGDGSSSSCSSSSKNASGAGTTGANTFEDDRELPCREVGNEGVWQTDCFPDVTLYKIFGDT